MNKIVLIGRITADPEVKFGASSKSYLKFTLAVNREDKEKNTDYIPCVAFGKTAELIGEYVTKGKLLGISGRWQSGKYEKDGRKYYTHECLVDRVEFLERRSDDDYVIPGVKPQEEQQSIPAGFSRLDDLGIPF